MHGPMSWLSLRRVQLSFELVSVHEASIHDDLRVVELRQSRAFSNQTAMMRSSGESCTPVELPAVKLPTWSEPAGAVALPVVLPVALSCAKGRALGRYTRLTSSMVLPEARL